MKEHVMTNAQRERNLDALDDYTDAEIVDHASNAGEDINAMEWRWISGGFSFIDAFRESPSCEWPRIAGEQHEKFVAAAAKELREKYVSAGGAPWLEGD